MPYAREIDFHPRGFCHVQKHLKGFRVWDNVGLRGNISPIKENQMENCMDTGQQHT